MTSTTAPNGGLDRITVDDANSTTSTYPDGNTGIQPPVSLRDASTLTTLKERIRHHYELASDYYYSLWGEHIHHGYFLDANDTKERAQVRLIELLLERSQLEKGSTVLDVGCGIGGITISGKQVEMATRLTKDQSQDGEVCLDGESMKLGQGTARFIELDAETMGDFFAESGIFDCVWISEAMSHLPNKTLFFRNAFQMLREGGKLVVADWFRAEKLSEKEIGDDIKPIEDGMLLPPLCTPSEYAVLAEGAGLSVFSETFDISNEVAKTW
ncbi:MAG: hypothetical protein Q9172_003192 [Xanthocarpia lactea]